MDDFAIEIDDGLERLATELAQIAARVGPDDVAVRWVFGGPAAPYALYVHENHQAHHRVGEAEFMVRPLLEAVPHFAADIAALMAAGQSLPAALRTVAELKMTEMKTRTPVEFGTLRDSGHVVMEIG